MSYQRWADEMTPVIRSILEGRRETPLNSAAEAWLVYILCRIERPVYRQEIIKKSESLGITLPSEHQIDWALEHLKARGWLLIAFGNEDAGRNGPQGGFVYRLRPDVTTRLKEIIGDLSVYREAHGKLNDWLSTHPPDSANEEAVLAYALYLSESALSLARVLEEMDAINVGFPNAHILGTAILRLRKRGWLIGEDKSAYGLTPAARQFIDTLVQRRTYRDGPDERLRAWMIANPPPGYEGEPIGDSYEEEMEEWDQVLRSEGLLGRGNEGERKGV